MRMIRISLLLSGLLGASYAVAHHAAAGLYDRNDIGEIEGAISSIFWRNPHVRLGITRVNENGEDEAWEVEFGSVNTVERLGVSRDAVEVGDRVRVSGILGREGRQAMFADSIIMLLEEWDGIRTIFMNDASSGTLAQPRMGYSVGRWEGNTLIIETTDIGWRYVDDLGTPQSENAVIAERFTLSQDGTELDWEARISDPLNFTEPVVMEGMWVWIPGQEIKPFNCALPENAE